MVTAVAALRERFGPTIIRPARELSLAAPFAERPALSTGALGLDLITAGLPRGAISEYAGRDGSGRETLAAVALARAQVAGGLVVLVDPGGAADPDALSAAGVNLGALTLAYPVTAAQGQGIVDALCRCGAADLLVITSWSGLLLLPGSRGLRWPGRLLARWRAGLRGRRTSLVLINHVVNETPWRTVEEGAVAREAALRLGLRAQGVELDPHGGVAGLLTAGRVVKHRGRPQGPPIELLIGAAGPHPGWELLRLAGLVGCLAQTPLGLVVGGHFLGRSPRRAAALLAADRSLATLVEGWIRMAWDTPNRGGILAVDPELVAATVGR